MLGEEFNARGLYAPALVEIPAFTGFSQAEHVEIAAKPLRTWLPQAAGDGEEDRDAGTGAWRCARFPAVKRTVAALISILAMMLVAAPLALADNGVGLAGPTTDKTVTFFCFGVLAFFVVLVVGMSLIQGKLEKRKERRRYDLERLN
jgi:hypothetical protein